jgi:PhnB protein
MTRSNRPIPEGFNTTTPHLIVRDVSKAIDFYTRALGAQELLRMAGPDGKTVMHGKIKIGNSIVFLGCEDCGQGSKSPLTLGGTTASVYLYVEDVDAVFERAKRAGAQTLKPVADMFWGDRYGKILDPFGHEWSIATHKEDLTPAQMEEKAKAFFAAAAVAS